MRGPFSYVVLLLLNKKKKKKKKKIIFFAHPRSTLYKPQHTHLQFSPNFQTFLNSEPNQYHHEFRFHHHQWRGSDPPYPEATGFSSERESQVRETRLPLPHHPPPDTVLDPSHVHHHHPSLPDEPSGPSPAMAPPSVQPRQRHHLLRDPRFRIHRLHHDPPEIRLPRGLFML